MLYTQDSQTDFARACSNKAQMIITIQVDEKLQVSQKARTTIKVSK